MEIEIKCHNCHLSFDIEVENDDGDITKLIHCEICKKPNQVDYKLENQKLITIEISDGISLKNSQWEDPYESTDFINHQKRLKEKSLTS